MGKKVLVTGACGFLGKFAVNELHGAGYEIEEFDLEGGNDILDYAQVENACRGKDIVVHLAAALDEALPYERLHAINVKGTENVLEACAKCNVKRLVFASSVGVMGNIAGEADESFPYAPETNYEKTKAEAERLVLKYQELLPVTILRFALLYGANSYWKQIIKLIKKGFPITGSGKNKFQLLYVKDAAGAIRFVAGDENSENEIYIAAEECANTLEGVYTEIANLLNVEIPKKHLPVWQAKLLAHVLLAKAKMQGKKTVIMPAHIDRLVRERAYNTGKISKLGWHAKYSLHEGMKETVEELKSKGEI
ncbi:MAG: NAD(P)-dependent oxidoreductase [Candidatus Diapherotrites archaeon]|nr:NAD(P)-dependent oxidoreductase [Candidatus Diapherotrites archaeon]